MDIKSPGSTEEQKELRSFLGVCGSVSVAEHELILRSPATKAVGIVAVFILELPAGPNSGLRPGLSPQHSHGTDGACEVP